MNISDRDNSVWYRYYRWPYHYLVNSDKFSKLLNLGLALLVGAGAGPKEMNGRTGSFRPIFFSLLRSKPPVYLWIQPYSIAHNKNLYVGITPKVGPLEWHFWSTNEGFTRAPKLTLPSMTCVPGVLLCEGGAGALCDYPVHKPKKITM